MVIPVSLCVLFSISLVITIQLTMFTRARASSAVILADIGAVVPVMASVPGRRAAAAAVGAVALAIRKQDLPPTPTLVHLDPYARVLYPDSELSTLRLIKIPFYFRSAIIKTRGKSQWE